MADAVVVNAVPSADDAQEHPVAAPAPAPAADDGKGKAPAADDDKGKGKVQPWEGRPCVVLALQAATAPALVKPKRKRRRQAIPAPAPAANRVRLESREVHVAVHALPTTRVPPPVSENHLPGNIPRRHAGYRHTSGCDACALEQAHGGRHYIKPRGRPRPRRAPRCELEFGRW
ncbi:uncharacterized protein [Aegilops tauschii subsp. strangulata]|uniref:uncharacterized protein n=1 Tax=Aegilops tauschii subsp. strangulata TaxID=200361 RepID=UPI001E1C9F48|nr:uncharacterized protein LOC120968439 [Aegilops tauschii subsp. strangulata]